MLEREEGKFDFVWMDEIIALLAARQIGVILCTPFIWPSSARGLSVHADVAAGELPIAALDEDGYPITELPPKRASGLEELRGRVVHLKFTLRNADLFGFSFPASANQ